MATADVADGPQDEPEDQANPGPETEVAADPVPESDPGAQVEAEAPTEPEALPEPASLGWDSSLTARPIALGWDAEPLVLDWEGKGRPDLLVTSGGGPAGRSARLYRTTSPGREFPPTYDGGSPVESLDGLRCLAAIPTGTASRFDLVALAPEGLVLLRNTGPTEAPAFGPREPLGIGPDLGAGPCRVAQVVAVDWDGDGLTDLLVGLDDLAAYWPDPVPVEQQVGFSRLGTHPGYDDRGQWRGRAPEGRIRWLKNIGEPGSPRFELQPEIVPESGTIGLDLNPAALAVSWGGGSAVELTVSDRLGLVRLYRNFGGQRPPVLMEPRPLKQGAGPLELPDDRTTLVAADLDGDRRVELLFGTADGKIFAIKSATGRDAASAPTPLLQESGELNLGGRAVVAVGDLDGDGGLDLVVGDAPGRLTLLKDVGRGAAHRYGLPVPVESGGEPFRLDPGPDGRLLGPLSPRLGYACPAVVDWTGNGRPDILIGGAGGELLLLRNDGSTTDPRFAPPAPFMRSGAPIITPPRVRPAAANWLGSGALDLIAIDLQGFLCVYAGSGGAELGAPAPLVDALGRLIRLDGGFGQNGRVSLWAGDWLGSGRPDLLVGLPREARYVVPALLGRPASSLDALSTVILLENAGRNVLITREVRLADGSPLVVGWEGCSPSGVPAPGGGLDLLVGSDDGRVLYVPRDNLRW